MEEILEKKEVIVKQDSLFEEPAIDSYTKVQQNLATQELAKKELNDNVNAVRSFEKLMNETADLGSFFQGVLKEIDASDKKPIEKINEANNYFLRFINDPIQNTGIDKRILEKNPKSYEEFKIHKDHFETMDRALKEKEDALTSANKLNGVDLKPVDPSRAIYEQLNDIFSPFWRSRVKKS